MFLCQKGPWFLSESMNFSNSDIFHSRLIKEGGISHVNTVGDKTKTRQPFSVFHYLKIGHSQKWLPAIKHKEMVFSPKQ